MSLILFLVILVALILVHEWGHFFVAKRAGIRVDEFGIGFPPKLWGKKRGETEYTVNALPFGGFVRIWGENPEEASPDAPEYKRSFIAKPRWQQALVLVAGVVMNVVFAWALFAVGFMVGMPSTAADIPPSDIKERRVVIGNVLEDSPAAEAGLTAGDRIISVHTEDESLTDLSAEAVTNYIRAQGGGEFRITYQRDGEARTASLAPERGVVAEDPDRAAIGAVMGEIAIVQLPPHRAVWEAIIYSGEILYAIVIALGTLIAGAFTLTADLSQIVGPVGIVSLVGNASEFGAVFLLSFTAFISLNLAIVNLLPFPALDGGRLLFLIIEKIKGSPIRPKVAQTANTIGFVLLILLMLAVTYNDIVRLLS